MKHGTAEGAISVIMNNFIHLRKVYESRPMMGARREKIEEWGEYATIKFPCNRAHSLFSHSVIFVLPSTTTDIIVIHNNKTLR